MKSLIIIFLLLSSILTRFSFQVNSMEKSPNGTMKLISLYYDSSQLTENIPESRTSVSDDGRFVVFSADEPLDRGDYSYHMDIFLRDTQLNKTIRISNNDSGFAANGGSYHPQISRDGGYITFFSHATDLVPNDVNGTTSDVFLYDAKNKTIEIVSKSSSGIQGDSTAYYPSISSNGRFIIYYSWSSNLIDNEIFSEPGMYVFDSQTKETKVIKNPTTNNLISGSGARISDDGIIVAFNSEMSDLIPNDYNNLSDIFTYNFQTEEIQLVTKSYDEGLANGWSYSSIDLSSNGKFVVFCSPASNLVENDINHVSDIFYADLSLGTIELVSITYDGLPSNNDSAPEVSISGDGRFVTFTSGATDLVQNYNSGGVFIRDMSLEKTSLISLTPNNEIPNGYSNYSSISNNGKHITFLSTASDLVVDDLNEKTDVFLFSSPYTINLPLITK